MKRASILFLALVLATGLAAADEKKAEKKKGKPTAEKKAKPAAKGEKSDKNVFQKSESSVGEWANRNKIWVTHKKNEKKD